MEINLKKVEAHSGEKTAYEVSVDGKPIGVVVSRQRGTFRMHGRIRYPTGREVIWGERGHRISNFYARTRTVAVARVVKDFREGRLT